MQEDADIRHSTKQQKQRQRRELEGEQVRETRTSKMKEYTRTVRSEEIQTARRIKGSKARANERACTDLSW